MSLKNSTIAFIGAGNMAEALIRGLLANKVIPAARIIATDVRPERLEELKKTLGIRTATDNAVAAREADLIVLAVKPQQMSSVLSGLRFPLSSLFLSIAAGVTTARIERELGSEPRVIRVMPNMPALVGAGAAALAKGKHATDEDLKSAEAILKAVGVTVRVDEKLFDAVTALSGSGPAYVFYVAEAMIRAGIEAGLPAEVAKKLVLQTVFGAGKLLVESSEPPDVLREKVTSPGGTTEAALKVLGKRKLMEIFAEAVQAAKKRSQELSGM